MYLRHIMQDTLSSHEYQAPVIIDAATIYNGDCISVMKQLTDNSIDLILTDPPYNLGLFMHKRGTNLKKMRENHFAYSGWDDLEFDTWKEEMRKFISECHRVLKKEVL